LSNTGPTALNFSRGPDVFDLQNLFGKTVPGNRQHGTANLLLNVLHRRKTSQRIKKTEAILLAPAGQTNMF
jgi:hypothetical protein